VTYRCNSRCLTCNVYTKQADEFTAEEFDRVFASMGRAPYWYTMSGGEPFLRRDLVEICESAYRHGRPGIINIPTNGLLSDRVPHMVDEIASRCPESQIIVNLSIDGVGPEHDRIRGVEGSYERALASYHALRALDAPNLALGIHTVVSVHNVERVPAIYEHVMRELAPDSFITEIAEERVELDTIGATITPDAASYARSIDFLIDRIGESDFKGISRVTQSFRARYYELVKKYLATGRQVIPCFSGYASAQIAPDGDVWFCCVRAEPIGSLREADYDFRKIWFSARARSERAKVRRGECACPLANASYTNMLMHLPTVAGVVREMATGGRAATGTARGRGE
jgi:MoaA/NifB/PqqE/SkfB family radical SAM enzyme